MRRCARAGTGGCSWRPDGSLGRPGRLINATGTWDRPFWPRYPGQDAFRGRQLHTAGYPGPQEFAGKRVIVVGGGTSAVQHLLEMADVAAETTWVTRRQPVFREGPFGEDAGPRRRRAGGGAGRPRAAAAERGDGDGAADDRGDAACPRERRAERLPMFERITPTAWPGATGGGWRPNVILWATGFRAAVDHLAPLRLREPGGGIRVEGTRVARDPRIHLVGYGPSASTIGANRAGRAAVRESAG